MKRKKGTRFFKFIKSLKFHLILIVLVLSFLPGIIISTILIQTYENNAVTVRESEISAQAMVFANQIATSGYLDNDKIGNNEFESELSMVSTLYNGRIVVVNDAFKVIYDTYNRDNRKIMIAKEVLQSFRGETVTNYDSKTKYIEMTLPIVNPNDENQRILGIMMLSASTANIDLNQVHLAKVAWIVVSISITVFAFFGILFSIAIVRPFKKVSTEIEHVQNGYSGETINVNTFTETMNICEQFNNLLSRIKVMDDSREEFVSNVSHELKTPLTSIKVLADSINSMPDAPIEMYQEFMGDITSEIDRETTIINDLLSLVKMDKSKQEMNITNMNINELVEAIIRRLQPIADRQKVALVLESFRPILADVDEVKITLAISNLIENAIKYNKNDGEGWVHISLNADHQYFYLKVEDSGMGIPEESLDHIYERFYRVDKSHSREIGGTGLGLAITRNAILMHRGAIKVYSVLGEGTTFDVRIPLTYMV